MSDIAIRVEGLSKQYRIGGPQARYRTVRESLVEAARAPFRRLASVARGQSTAVSNETIWALKDVSFEVERGEVVGIIGRNGAGKTTLLKVLSRITEPTEGYAEIHGRVGSLLEVGTGFHPELTGGENIYLNGAILGMKRAEIEKKFDEIVAFAEVERFIDTPVKHYSSGMYVRLAFAVAAHLDPEILLVDEVLAVGDAQFQKKCLGKMESVAGEGRTVLFVSHNMTAILRLCENTLVLQQGRVGCHCKTDQAITHYTREFTNVISTGEKVWLVNHPGRRVESKPVIRCVVMATQDGRRGSTLSIGCSATFSIDLDPGGEEYSNCKFGLGIFDLHGQLIVPFRTEVQHSKNWALTKPKTIQLIWHECLITPGIYTVKLAFASGKNVIDWIEEAFDVEVQIDQQGGTFSKSGQGMIDTTGVLVPRASWCI
jgi:lipopolysaccharide transport system ATP-binding protein